METGNPTAVRRSTGQCRLCDGPTYEQTVHVCRRLCGACGRLARWLVSPTGEYDRAAYCPEPVCDADLASYVADSIVELQRVEIREIGTEPTLCACPVDDQGEPIAHVSACPRYEPLRDLDKLAVLVARDLVTSAAGFAELAPEPLAGLVSAAVCFAYDRRFGSSG